MKNYKPLMNRIIVFSVPVRRRLEGSVLFKGNARRSAFNRAEEVWVVACGQLCKEQIPMGSHGWIDDSFQLDPTDLSIWDDLKDRPEFSRLKDFVHSVDGDVQVSIILEGSLLALDDDYEISTAEKQMPKD
jgi:hypothetical protein